MRMKERFFGNEVVVWGRNATIGTSPWEELYAYDQGLDWNAILAAAAKIDVTSSSAADTSAGAGAQKATYYGLDTNFAFQEEEITLNGQTIVQSAKSFLRIFGGSVTAIGATGPYPTGDLHAVKTGTGGSYTTGVPGTLTSALCKILVGYGDSGNGMYTIPAGTVYKLKSLYVSTRAQAITFGIFERKVGANPIFAVDPIELNTGTNISLDFEALGMKIHFTEKTDVMMRAFAAGASGVASAAMVLKRVSP